MVKCKNLSHFDKDTIVETGGHIQNSRSGCFQHADQKMARGGAAVDLAGGSRTLKAR